MASCDNTVPDWAGGLDSIQAAWYDQLRRRLLPVYGRPHLPALLCRL